MNGHFARFAKEQANDQEHSETNCETNITSLESHCNNCNSSRAANDQKVENSKGRAITNGHDAKNDSQRSSTDIIPLSPSLNHQSELHSPSFHLSEEKSVRDISSQDQKQKQQIAIPNNSPLPLLNHVNHVERGLSARESRLDLDSHTASANGVHGPSDLEEVQVRDHTDPALLETAQVGMQNVASF